MSRFVYLIYIDESGKPAMTDPENEFVLAALIINEHEWSHADHKVRMIKSKHFPGRDPGSLELHASDIISRKGAFKRMPLEKRLEIMEDILKTVSEIDCSIVFVLSRKDRSIDPSIDLGMYATKILFEQIDDFHYVMNKMNETRRSADEHGILLIDSVDSKYDNKVRSKIRELCADKLNRHIIEDPFFVDSKHKHMSQLVDSVAYCIRRRFRSKTTDPTEMEIYERFYRIIETKIFKTVSGSMNIEPKLFCYNVRVRGRGATSPH